LPRMPLQEGFDSSQWFFGLLSCTVRDAADGQGIELVDSASSKAAVRVTMPSGAADSLPIYLGMGQLLVPQGNENAVPSGPANHEVVSQGLDRIRTELRRIGVDPPTDGGIASAGSDVAPIVPDALRFLAIAKSRLSRATTGWPGGCK